MKFKTFPDPRLGSGTNFKFIATSCILPNFPYVPGKGDRIKGFDLLYSYMWPDESNPSNSSNDDIRDGHLTGPQSINSSLPVEFLLTMGDFIYADVPAYFGSSLEAYQRLYRRMYASPSFRRVYESLREPTSHSCHSYLLNLAYVSSFYTHL